MLKFTFMALHSKQKVGQSWSKVVTLGPTMFHTVTVRPTRSDPIILYNTSLSFYDKVMRYIVPEIEL